MSKRSKLQQSVLPTVPLEPLLDIPQVAQLLGISRPTVYTLFSEGLPSIRLGKTRRIAPSSLRQFLKEREQIA